MHLGFPTIRNIPESEEDVKIRRQLLFRQTLDKKEEAPKGAACDTESLQSASTLVAQEQSAKKSTRKSLKEHIEGKPSPITVLQNMLTT